MTPMFKRNVIKTLLIKGEIARIWGPLFGPQNTKTALQISVMQFSAVRGGFENENQCATESIE
jgi:hypothetical protein